MAQGNRVILPGLPHFVAQRGRSGDHTVFREPTDFRVFLHLLEESCGRYEVAIWGYTLLARSYSLILVPDNNGSSLDGAMKRLDSEYAHYHNLRHMVRGPVWGGSYRSVAMCWSEVWDAIVYAEREPVRDARIGVAWAHTWSSAAARVGRATAPGWLGMAEWEKYWNRAQWMKRLQAFPGEAEFERKLTAGFETGALGDVLAGESIGASGAGVAGAPRMGPRRAGTASTRLRVVGGGGAA